MEKINGRKLSLIFIFILILLVIALLVGKFTFSYLGPTISEDLETQGEVTASGDTLIFTKGKTMSLSASTDNFATGGSNLSTTTNPKVKLIASTKTNEASATYYVGVLIKNNSYVYTTSGNTPELILTIKDEKGNNVTAGVDGLTYVTSGGVSGFDVTGKKGLFNIKTDYPISTTSSSAGTTHTWTFTLTFVNLGTDQSDNENASMNVDIYLQKEEYKLPLNEYVISQYTGTQGENGIYYHNSSLTDGAGDNSYRFAGASDQVNNYVCFGSSGASCTADNLYRIIGVFDNKVGENQTEQRVKLIKSTSVGNKAWDSNNKNTWSTSSLNTYLNNEFINIFDETIKGKIAETTWKVGGNTYANIAKQPAKTAYQNEVVEPVLGQYSTEIDYKAKIGLMYASDYGFAAAPSAWTANLGTYNGEAIINVNWMYLQSYEWTISRLADYYTLAFNVIGIGDVGEYEYNVTCENAVRPVFYLSSSVNYASGSGSATDPIVVN